MWIDLTRRVSLIGQQGSSALIVFPVKLDVMAADDIWIEVQELQETLGGGGLKATEALGVCAGLVCKRRRCQRQKVRTAGWSIKQKRLCMCDLVLEIEMSVAPGHFWH